MSNPKKWRLAHYDVLRWPDGSAYAHRITLLETPWAHMRIHWTRTEDPEPHLHDHPGTFLSLIVFGWYEEIRPNKPVRIRRWLNLCRVGNLHRITRVSRWGCLSFLLCGPRVKTWGYLVGDTWVPYTKPTP